MLYCASYSTAQRWNIDVLGLRALGTRPATPQITRPEAARPAPRLLNYKLIYSFICWQLWDADSSGMQTALGMQIFGSLHVFDGWLWDTRLRWIPWAFMPSMRYACFMLSCDMSCIMLHAICLVSYFMRYALYHASCDMPCIMLHAKSLFYARAWL